MIQKVNCCNVENFYDTIEYSFLTVGGGKE